VALAALISAYHEDSAPGDGLRATLPLAGRTLIERQARLAASAGAAPIVILVERMPAELLAAVDRLRSEGVPVKIARSVSEAADSVHPDDRLLLLADGFVADESHVARVAAAEGPILLTVADQASDERFERIDAQSRWAGVAALDGNMLKSTAAMLGEWDLQSTLLRRVIQAGARQFALRGEAADDRLTIAETGDDLAEVEASILGGAADLRRDWVSRWLLAPVERLATQLLMPTAVSPEWLRITAAVLTGLGAFLFARQWIWPGLIILLVATPLDGTAERLATLRMQPAAARGWAGLVLPVLGAAALLALGTALGETRGWGCIVLAASTIGFMIALRQELEGENGLERTFLAERKAMTWLLLPFAIGGLWVAGLSVLAAYAAGSFFWVQRLLHRRKTAKVQD
jgi:hypothetical protein